MSGPPDDQPAWLVPVERGRQEALQLRRLVRQVGQPEELPGLVERPDGFDPALARLREVAEDLPHPQRIRAGGDRALAGQHASLS